MADNFLSLKSNRARSTAKHSYISSMLHNPHSNRMKWMHIEQPTSGGYLQMNSFSIICFVVVFFCFHHAQCTMLNTHSHLFNSDRKPKPNPNINIFHYACTECIYSNLYFIQSSKKTCAGFFVRDCSLRQPSIGTCWRINRVSINQST